MRLAELLEALAVGTLILGRLTLMGADLDAGQTAVVGVLTMVRTAGDSAFDGAVGGAMAAVLGTILLHNDVLLLIKNITQAICPDLVYPLREKVCFLLLENSVFCGIWA